MIRIARGGDFLQVWRRLRYQILGGLPAKTDLTEEALPREEEQS